MLVQAVLVMISLVCCIHAEVDVKGVGPTAFDPKLAFNNQGDALIVWNTGGSNIGGLIQYAIYDKEVKTFGAPILIPNITASSLHIAVSCNNRGDALVVWDTVLGHIQYSIYDKSTKTLGSPQTILGTGAYSIDPSVTLNDEGDAFAVWYDAQMNIQYSLYHKIDRKFEIAKTLGESKTSTKPQIVMNNKGDAILLWYDIVKEIISYVVYDKIAKFGSIQTILDTKSGVNQVVALNNQTDAVIAWNTGSETTLSGLIQYAVYNKDAKSFSSIKTIPSIKGNLAQNAIPQIALNDKGDALLTWCTLTADGKDPLWYAFYNKTSKQFETPNPIIGAITYSTAPELALNAKGEAVIAWFTTMNGTIQYAVYNRLSKVFEPAQLIIGFGNNSEFPVIAFNNERDGLLVWSVFGGIQYSIYDKVVKNFSFAKNLLK